VTASGGRPRFIALAAVVISAFSTATGGEEPIRYRRTVVRYAVPDVTLRNQDGARVRLPQALSSDRPVLLNFLFTTCTTVCPVLATGFSSLRRALGPDDGAVRLISIATDPDHDTPEVLRVYRKRFDAGPEWEFLTGSREDIDRVLRAFDAASAIKQAHRPLSFLRSTGGESWVRIDGLVGVSDLLTEYRGLSRD
jgi:protein SCO1